MDFVQYFTLICDRLIKATVRLAAGFEMMSDSDIGWICFCGGLSPCIKDVSVRELKSSPPQTLGAVALTKYFSVAKN